MNLFRIYRELRGTLLHPRAGQIERGVRIDRLLVPTPRLLELGWAHQTIGVEIKRSGAHIGPALAQALDYVHSVFDLDGLAGVVPTCVFVWPMEKQSGPLASLMANMRVGSASSQHGGVKLAFGEEVLFDSTNYRGVRNVDPLRSAGRSVISGRKVGSR